MLFPLSHFMQWHLLLVDPKPFLQGENPMKGPQANHPSSTASSHHSRFMFLIAFSIGIVFAFVLSACSANALSSVSSASVAHPSTSSTAAGYPVKVFFSKFPESVNTDFTAVYPVDRTSPTIATPTPTTSSPRFREPIRGCGTRSSWLARMSIPGTPDLERPTTPTAWR